MADRVPPVPWLRCAVCVLFTRGRRSRSTRHEMAWSGSKRLIDLSRDPDPGDDRRADDSRGAEPPPSLPEDETGTETLARRAFRALAEPPATASREPPVLVAEPSVLERALRMCGLPDADVYAKMFSVSKWAVARDDGPAALSLPEFVTVVERFSAPVRLRERDRRNVRRYMADRGLRAAYAYDDGRPRPDDPESSGTRRDAARPPAVWNDVLDGLTVDDDDPSGSQT